MRGEIIREKVQTSLWLEKDVKLLIANEDLNLSKFVNEAVLAVLSVDTPEKVEAKIRLKESELVLLNKRLEKLQAAKKSDGEHETDNKIIWDVLKENFKPRSRSGFSLDQNMGWISSPKNLKRCRDLNMSPMEVLGVLLEVNNGVKASE